MNTDQERLRNDLYDLFGYMASAARELMVDPQIYGPFRLVDTLSRSIALSEQYGLRDPFFHEIQDYIDHEKYLMMSDEEGFSRFLEELVVKFAEKTEDMGS